MAFRSSSHTPRAAGATALTGSAPAGTIAGDYLAAFVVLDGITSDTVTPPAGWTSRGSFGFTAGNPDGSKCEIFDKIATGSDSYAFSTSVSNDADLVIGCWSGRDQANPRRFLTVSTPNTTANATPVNIGLTSGTAQPGDDIAFFGMLDITVGTDTWAYAPPAGFTEQRDVQQAFATQTLATVDASAGGALGTLTAVGTRTAGTGAAGWGGVVIAIIAAAVAGPQPSQNMIDWATELNWKPQRWDFPLSNDLLLDDFLPAAAPSGAMSGTASMTFGQSGTLVGAGALAGNNGMTFGQTGTLRGAGALVGTAPMTFAQTGALAGAGALSGTNGMMFGQTGTLRGSATLAGTATTTFGQTGSLAGAGALSGTAPMTFGQFGQLDQPSGAMSGTAAMVFSQTGTLRGAGALVGSASMTFGQTGALAGAGALSGTVAVVFGQTGTLRGGGALVGTATLTFGQSGTLDQPASGAISGTASMAFSQSGLLRGAGALSGIASLTFGQSGTLDQPPVAVTFTTYHLARTERRVFRARGEHDPQFSSRPVQQKFAALPEQSQFMIRRGGSNAG